MNLKQILKGAASCALTLAVTAMLPVAGMAQDISGPALQQIQEILAQKAQFTTAQKKMSSALVFAAKAARNELNNSTINDLIPPVPTNNQGRVTVDIRGSISSAVLSQIVSVGGQVVTDNSGVGVVRASLPVGLIDFVAALPEVVSVKLPAQPRTSGIARKTVAQGRRHKLSPGSLAGFVGAVTSQGYVAHAANTAVGQGYTGAGVKVGVLSDSASPARVAALIASGDLGANTVVLPGQDGTNNSGFSDEGTAMMELIHDLAPGAQLYFASAFNGDTSFAANIIALQQAGCKIIVDDVSYSNEGAFQDTVIAQAVNQVTAAGVLYFSSAANSGNLTSGTSGTWEGDFLNGGAVSGPIAAAGETGLFHNFGTVGSPQNFNRLAAKSPFDDYVLHWSDPFGASSNDYDLFLLNSTGTTLKGFSASSQNGTQDPLEEIYVPGGSATNDRLVVVLFSGSPRALHVDTSRGALSIATSGATIGHNAGLNTVTLAATAWNSAHAGTRPFTGAANPIEPFSSDGPRKIFYDATGAAITPGNFLFGTNGGTTLQKPDLTAADGTYTKTPGFLPFFGTSAASPHAAAIAALVLQARPTYTAAQIKAAMVATALDNMAPGADRDGGYGITMAWAAVQYALAH